MNRRPHAARQRGLTLIELILAISITAVVGLAVVGMLSAVDYGTNSSRDLRELVVRGKTLTDRINQAVRYAEAVVEVQTDAADAHLLLHAGTNENDEPTYLLLRHDAEAGTLLAYRQTYPADSGAPTTDALANTTARSWASGVKAWQIDVDPPDSPTPLINYRLTLTVRDAQQNTAVLEQTIVGAATPRNR